MRMESWPGCNAMAVGLAIRVRGCRPRCGGAADCQVERRLAIMGAPAAVAEVAREVADSWVCSRWGSRRCCHCQWIRTDAVTLVGVLEQAHGKSFACLSPARTVFWTHQRVADEETWALTAPLGPLRCGSKTLDVQMCHLEGLLECAGGRLVERCLGASHTHPDAQDCPGPAQV